MQQIETVGVVIINIDKVLLVKNGVTSKHKTGMYGLPAGRIEENETKTQSAVRELHEETGIRIKEEDLSPLNEVFTTTIEQKDGPAEFVWYVFVCTKFEGLLVSTPEADPQWVRMSEVSNLSLLPNVQNAIEQARQLKY